MVNGVCPVSLRQPPGGYQWVQADGHYVPVAFAIDLIADALFGD